MAVDWDRLWTLFHDALDYPEDERNAFATEKAGDDTELKDELLALLAAHRNGDNATLLHSGWKALDDLDPESLNGEHIGPYRLMRVLGEGGMGVVYEAEQQQLHRKVALKLIRLGMDTRQVIARFESERQSLAMMNHPNVAKVLDAGATDAGRPYFVMELVDGIPITDYCDEQRLNTDERLELFLAVCAGVQHAHQKGIIHRDLKPSNVLVAVEDQKPVPKIIDFGIAKATEQQAAEETLFTQVGMLIGTPEYMSPEQAGLSALGIDTRTDVYSLGILLFELLVGALPFEAAELRRAGYDEMRRRIREDEPARPSARLSTLSAKAEELAHKRRTDSLALVQSLRGDLDWITMHALEKDPDQRYSSPTALADDLRRHLNHEPVIAGPPSPGYRLKKFVRRNRLAVAACCAVALSLVVGFTAASVGFFKAREAEQIARAEARTAEEVSAFLTGLFDFASPSERDVNSKTAREVLDRGVERIRSELSNEPAVQVRLMQEMGKVYAQLGLLPEAEQLFEDALRTQRSLSDSTARDLSESIAGLAGVRHLAGRHTDAVDDYRQAIAAADDDAIWLATLHRSLGGVLNTLGQNAEAMAELERAKRVLEGAGLTENPELGRVLRNIGMAHWSEGDYDSARDAYNASLAVYDQSLEPGHPEVSYVVNSLAILNYNLGDFAAARPMFERELANLKRTLGPEHRNTASVMNNLGFLLIEMQRFDEAKPYITESLRIREAVLGPSHEEVATSYCNLARLQIAAEEFVQANESAQRCVSVRETTLGENHVYVAGGLELQATALRKLERESDAVELEKRAAQIRETNSGPGNDT